MDLSGARIAFVLPSHGFSDTAFNEVTRIFANTRADIVVASLNKEDVESNRNMIILPDKAVEHVDIEEVDAVILLGCHESVPTLEHEPVYNLLRAADENRVLIGAVCAAPLVLAKLSLLEDRVVTGHETVLEKAGEYGFTVADDAVAVDDHIVTASEEYAALFAEEAADVLLQHRQDTE